MRNLKNRVFVVTGAASGIGRELVLHLVQKGANVAAVDIHEKELLETRDLAKGYGQIVSTHICDVADKQAVELLPHEVLKTHRKIDGIINNAGIIQPMVHFEDLSPDMWDKLYNINSYGVYHLTRVFLPFIKQTDEGYIVNVSSMGGFLPVPGQSLYGATKSSVKLFTEALYAELKNTNVNVSVVFPGAIATNIAENSGLDLNIDPDNIKIKMTSASDAAKIILRGMEKEKLRILVGKDAKMMDKLYRFFPVFAVNMMQKMLANTMN